MSTLQDNLSDWQDPAKADAMIDDIIDQLGDGVVDDGINMDLRSRGAQAIVAIEADRAAYIATRISQIQAAIEWEESEGI